MPRTPRWRDIPEDEIRAARVILRSETGPAYPLLPAVMPRFWRMAESRPGTLPVSHHEGRTLGTTTRLPAPPLATVSARPGEQPPDEITRGLFGRGRALMRTHPLATDTLLAAVLLALSSVWLAGSGFASYRAALVQTALIAPLPVRRLYPSAVFLVTSAIAFAQWLLGFPLLGDAALLVALYTVAAHQSRLRALLATWIAPGLCSYGLAVRRELANMPKCSLLFLSATVVAASFAGLTVASGSRAPGLDGRARSQASKVERDQQAVIAAAAERTRIARELHDIVSHSLSVVITLADAAAVVSRADPARGVEAMAEVSEVGRRALTDMRAMLGVLRTDEPVAGLAPQPGIGDLGTLVERVRATGLPVDLAVEGTPFPLGAAAELTAYRIVQEALTNTLRHAAARRASVTIVYDEPQVRVRVADDGTARGGTARGGHRGHGIDGMRERAALHGGTLRAGPAHVAQIPRKAGWSKPPSGGPREHLRVAGGPPAAATPRLPHDPGDRG